MFAYPVELAEQDGEFIVDFPDIPECHTVGDTRAEALAQARDALESALSLYIDQKRLLPRPSLALGRPVVSPSALAALKAELYMAMREKNVTKAELARRLKVSKVQAQRLCDIMHQSRLDQIEAALAALGKRVLVTTQELRADLAA
jgi:antitoxin HicB